MGFTPFSSAPEEYVLDRIEEILRNGYSTALVNDGDDWTGERCPADHWIIQENSRFFRNDEPDEEERPCVIIGVVEGTKPTYENCFDVWDVPVFIELRYSRRYSPTESRLKMAQLSSVFTHGLTPDADPFIPAKTILSVAATAQATGLNVIHIFDTVCMPVRAENATYLTLQFTVRCSGIAYTA